MFFLCKQKTAYEMRISDWSSDVCSSDLSTLGGLPEILCQRRGITIVDTAIRHRLQGIQLGLPCLGQGGQIARIELEADGISVFLLHNVVFPFDRLFGPK